ncbi:MAG: hypothetical protein AAGI50_00875 [Pseudomonadota bacterium]
MPDPFGVSYEAVSLHGSDDFSDVLGVFGRDRGGEQVEGGGHRS